MKANKIIKLFISISVLFITSIILVGCYNNRGKIFEIGFISTEAGINDNSFNQVTYESLKKYAVDNNKFFKFYTPLKNSQENFLKEIENSIDQGAKIVFVAGFDFSEAIYTAQEKYPDTKFVIIDAEPSKDGKTKTAKNTLSLLYKENEASFLAGYASYNDNYRLGFVGGQSYPPVQRFGIGFVFGAYYAAHKQNKLDYQFDARAYEYLNTFTPSTDAKRIAQRIYNSYADVIQTAAGAAGMSVMNAASTFPDKYLIGVDIDQAKISDRVIASSIKKIPHTVTTVLDHYYKNIFRGGQTLHLGLKEAAVGLAKESMKFKNLSFDDAYAIIDLIKEDKLSIPDTSQSLKSAVLALSMEISDTLIKKIDNTK